LKTTTAPGVPMFAVVVYVTDWISVLVGDAFGTTLIGIKSWGII